MQAQQILRQYFGHEAFRPGQQELIEALIGGRDVVGVMPTGAGKSMCYQIPALAQPGVTLVISPLISLMCDQVTALIHAGIPAAYINSSLTAGQISTALRRAAQGRYKIIYVAPERLETAEFLEFACQAEVSLVAVDEAHCVSQWGQDFRPSYLKIAAFIEKLPVRPPVGAFTATATARVRSDIVRLLKLRNPLPVTTGFDRPNLFFDVIEVEDRTGWIVSYAREHAGSSGIVYAATRKGVEQLCTALQEAGLPATRYHAGLSEAERARNQEDFVFDRAEVIVATNAFGMGIDKSNVAYVLHANMPKNLESYYQEAGRAGRDGAKAECILLFAPSDIQTARFFIEHGEDNEALTVDERFEVKQQEYRRLDQMVAYCHSTHCLRGFILSYFGEAPGADCGYCGVCLGHVSERDYTREARKVILAVGAIWDYCLHGVGAGTLVKVLRGSSARDVLSRQLDDVSGYGALEKMPRDDVRALVDRLLEMGILQEDGDYRVVRLARPLAADERVVVRIRSREEYRHERALKKAARQATVNEALYARLKQVRSELAQSEHVPAFVIFSNATLQDMARRAPHTMAELREVSGIGAYKAGRYGEVFLEAIREQLSRAGR